VEVLSEVVDTPISGGIHNKRRDLTTGDKVVDTPISEGIHN
jgi:hypothetical protein